MRMSDPGPQMFIGPERPTPEAFDAVSNPPEKAIASKPDGGLWTSTVRDDGGSAWLDWCHANDWFGPDDRIWILEPENPVDLLVIDDARDLYSALAEYERDDVPEFVGRVFSPFDWDALADDFDGFRVSERGQIATRFSTPGLYGWDAESTVWFRWAFSSVEDRGPVHDAPEVDA